MSPQQSIAAAGYLRKSTKGKNASGKERQEKSLDQQRREITELAKGRYRIVRWYVDEGVSGWKRNGKRPQFDQMLTDAKERRDFQVVLCDDLDRFSRAEVMEVFSDLSTLSTAGIKAIHCVNQGEYGLGENDIGRIIKMVVDVHGGNEFSRKLSRRITLAHRNRAKEGKRSAVPPYGMANDGDGGLRHGDPAHIKVVRRIFDQFVDRKQSLNSIASRLNAEGVPAPRGGKWFVMSVKCLLQRNAYRGDFAFGRRQGGRFFTVGKDGEVVESKERTELPWKSGTPTFHLDGIYKPLVPPATWDAAQNRLASFSLKGSRRPRTDGYPLSGVLICGHCGKPMYGCRPRPDRKDRVYRCSTPAKTGAGTCGAYWISEDAILPYVLRALGEEISDVRKMLTAPPAEIRSPHRERVDQREQVKRERDSLAATISKAEDNLLRSNDARTRQSLDRKISEMRDELDRRDTALAEEVGGNGYSKDDVAALTAWWDEFNKNAVSVPVPTGKVDVVSNFHRDPFADNEVDYEYDGEGNLIGAYSDRTSLLMDARIVNEALHALGAEVRLRWATRKVTLSTGEVQNRYTLAGGRFRLGQRNVTLCKAPFAADCSCTVAWGRRGSHTGRGSSRRPASGWPGK
jgi:site-specific DNA recombinase